MKKLTEIYGLNEGPFDDINRQLAGAQSVARDPRSPQQRARVGQSGAVQKAQADLDQSKSVFAKEAIENWDQLSVEELWHELAQLTESMPANERASALKLIMTLQKKVEGGDSRSTFSSSYSTGRAVGGLKLQ
jgi:hypothetical protein